MMERLPPKPLQQLLSIFRRKYVLDRIFPAEGDDPFRDCEQEKVVVAEYDARRGTQILDESKNREGGRPPIDQITDEPQSVRRRIELDAIDQLIELRSATLDIADGIGGHGWGGVRQLNRNRAGEYLTGIVLQ
jgi:hypothetical protein